LRSLLLFIAASGGILGLCKAAGIEFGMAFFAIGFFALMALLAGLMSVSQRSLVVVHQTDAATEAMLCRNYLREHGLQAVVDDGAMPAFSGVRTRVSRVLVPAHEVHRARQLLDEIQTLTRSAGEIDSRPT
jgi:hypothetical protein